MRSKIKKLGALLMASAMVVALVGCGNEGSGDSASDSGEKVTLRFSFDQGVGEPTQKIVDEFNKSQDNRIYQCME